LNDAILTQEMESVAISAAAIADIARSIVATKTMDAAMSVHASALHRDIDSATRGFWHLQTVVDELGHEIDSFVA
jgi:hypothetical protein